MTPADPDRPSDDPRELIATASRILESEGLAREITGHVSARDPDRPDRLWIRCRAPDDSGLGATTPASVHQVGFDGEGDTGADRLPLEFPIHAEVLRARPDVHAVVHVHPPWSLLCGLAGVEIAPAYGAYDHHALLLVAGGVPVLPSSLLIRSTEQAHELVTCLGSAPACLLRGHGVVVTGGTVEEATLRALRLEHLAQMLWQLHLAGSTWRLPQAEIDAFEPHRKRPLLEQGHTWAWNHYVRRSHRDEERVP